MEDTNANTVQMNRYIGTKIIHAEPMEEQVWLSSNKGINVNPLPEGADGIRDGYMVEYEDGYRSWSPKDVFEKAYRLCEEMNFGLAIEAMKKGLKVSRKGWNGKNMWLRLVSNGDASNEAHGGHVDLGEDGAWAIDNFIGIKTADDKFVPWLASQTDMLSDDYFIVE